jgi:3-oxoacid CoA-transferase subunit B
LERAPGVTDEIIKATEGTLIMEGEIPEMILIKEIENS